MTRYALIIGIASYSSFRNLPKAAADAEAFAKILEAHGGFYKIERLPKRWVREREEYEISPQTPVLARDLIDVLKNFLRDADGADAVIYFAGHGFQVADYATEEEQGFLATSDSKPSGLNAISLSRQFAPVIRKSNVSSLSILLDCCYAGAVLESGSIDTGTFSSAFSVFGGKLGYHLITACRSRELSRETEEHGLFTSAVLQGLSQEQANRVTGKVTVNALYDFVYDSLEGCGQEPIQLGIGRPFTLVSYPTVPVPNQQTVLELDPYRGLLPFEKEHESIFFGRTYTVETILKQLQRDRFVAVIGPSGSGKSSVVKAGLIPLLEQNSWQALDVIVPSDEPLTELRNALKPLAQRSSMPIRQLSAIVRAEQEELQPLIDAVDQTNQKHLLVVDQFEELFTVCRDEEERLRFIHLISQLSVRSNYLSVVVTLRADFLDSCLKYQSLTDLIQSQSFFIPPLAGASLAEAVIEPTRAKGYDFEPGLIEAIFIDVGTNRSGTLPLLQFALTELWERRDHSSRLLLLQRYEEMGRVSGTLDRYAENIYRYKSSGTLDSLSPSLSSLQERTAEEHEWIRRIFLRLLKFGEDGRDTRKRVKKSDLIAIVDNQSRKRAAFQSLLEELVQGRLLVAEREERVSIAHEALLEGWVRLDEWRSNKRDLRRLCERLEDALREWQRDSSEENLLMGGLLTLLRENWETIRPDLDKVAREFFQYSIEYDQLRTSQIQKAEIEMLNTLSQALLLSNNELEALVAALKAGKKLKEMIVPSLDTSAQVVTRLRQVIYRLREKNRLEGHTNSVYEVSFSPDGQLLASASEDNTIRLWRQDGELIHVLEGHTESVNSVDFSSDGQLLASASEDNTIRLWRQDGELIHVLEEHTAGINTVSFSPNNQFIVSASEDHTVRLWKSDGTFLRVLKGHTDAVASAYFSPDSEVVISASADKTIRLWRIDGTVTEIIKGHSDHVRCARFSPDAKTIVSGSWDNTIRLWKCDGTQLNILSGHSKPLRSVCFSPDGKFIASGSWDETVKLWQKNGNLLKTLVGHSSVITDVCFSPDGQTLVSASEDGSVKFWQYKDELFKILRAHSAALNSICFSSDGKVIASASEDNTINLWDADGSLVNTLKGHSHWVRCVRFSPDQKYLVSSSEDKTIRIWKREDGALLRSFKAHSEAVYSIDVSPDGKTIASCSWNRTVKLWNMQGVLLNTLEGHTAAVWSVRFSPDGQFVASAGWDNVIRLWSITGQLVRTFDGHTDRIWQICFSPDSQLIASASSDRTLKIWKIDGNLLTCIKGHRDRVWSVCFSPDGELVASAGTDKTVRLWRLDGELVETFEQGVSIRDVSFSPDGTSIASAAEDNSVILSDLKALSLDEMLQYGSAWSRNFLLNNVSVSQSDRTLAEELLSRLS